MDAALRSFRETVKRNEDHDGSSSGAAVSGTARPIRVVLDSESKIVDHVFLFSGRGLWGEIGRSRDIGLHGRNLLRSLRDDLELFRLLSGFSDESRLRITTL